MGNTQTRTKKTKPLDRRAELKIVLAHLKKERKNCILNSRSDNRSELAAMLSGVGFFSQVPINDEFYYLQPRYYELSEKILQVKQELQILNSENKLNRRM